MSDDQESYEADQFEATTNIPLTLATKDLPSNQTSSVTSPAATSSLSSRKATAANNITSARKQGIGNGNPTAVIAQLQSYNDELQQQVNTVTAQLNHIMEQQQQLSEQLNLSQRHSDDLNAQVLSLQQQCIQLKQQHTADLTQIARLEHSNVELLASQVKEKNARAASEDRLFKCENALRKEREDNSRIKAEKKGADISRTVDNGEWELEREGWRNQTMTMTARIESLDQQLKESRKKEKESEHALHQAQQVIATRETEAAQLREHLVNALRTANDASDSANATQAAVKHEQELNAAKQQTIIEYEKELKHNKDTIRLANDRINSLVFQLDRVDEWKIQKEAQDKEREAQLMEIRGVCDSQEKHVSLITLAKERSQNVISILEERLGKESKKVSEAREKCYELEKTIKGLVATLRDKESEHDHLCIKYEHLSTKYENSVVTQQQEHGAYESLQSKYNTLHQETELFRIDKQRLEDEAVVHAELLKDKAEESESFKKKDEIYKKIQEMLMNSAATSDAAENLLGLLTANNEKYVKYTNPVTKGKLKLALQTQTGQKVKLWMKRCELESRDLIDWCIEPQRMIDGLYELIKQIKNMKNLEAFSNGSNSKASASGSTHTENKSRNNSNNNTMNSIHGHDEATVAELEAQIELLNGKNSSLHSDLVYTESDKNKALMRYITSLAARGRAIGGLLQDRDSQETKFFLTELDANNQQQQTADDTPSSSSSGPASHSSISVYRSLALDVLQLSDLGMRDPHVQLLCTALHRCQSVREIDLHNNSIGNSSILALIQTCLTADNTVTSIDAQQNLITLDGLEDIVFMILKESSSAAKIKSGEEEKEQSESSVVIQHASLCRQGSILLPILELRLAHKTLVVDLRFNRLQQHPSAEKQSRQGESIKQMMKRVLLRITRALQSIGSRESDDQQQRPSNDENVDWDSRQAWMTSGEVAALIARNAARKEKEDTLKAALISTFETTIGHNQHRKLHELDGKTSAAVLAANKTLSATGIHTINGAKQHSSSKARTLDPISTTHTYHDRNSGNVSPTPVTPKSGNALPALNRTTKSSNSASASSSKRNSGSHSSSVKPAEEHKTTDSNTTSEQQVEGGVETGEDDYATEEYDV